MRRAFTRLLTVTAVAYCAGLVTLALLWSFGPHTKWLTLSSIVAPFLFAPLFLLAPLAFFVRSRWLRGSVLVLLGLFVLLFGARFLPPGPAEAAEDMVKFRVVTFNQLYTNMQVDAVLDTLLAQDADLVAVQELSPTVVSALRTRLGDVYPYADFRAFEGTQGVGLFSRYPLTSVTYHWYPQVQRATVTVGGVDITVLNVHPPAPFDSGEGAGLGYLGYDPQAREPEFSRLLSRIDETSGPRIVLGDFNLSDREPLYEDLGARLTDVYRAAAWGFGYTFPNYMRVRGVPVPPFIRIDYVWVGGGVVPVDAKVVCDGGSDHCMVVADVGILNSVLGEVPPEPAEDAAEDAAEDSFEIIINFTAEPASSPVLSTPGSTGDAAQTP